MSWNQMLDDAEPQVNLPNEEQQRWNIVAEALRNEADFEVFQDRQERMDWDLEQWVQWGLATLFEPVADIPGWQQVLRDAFTNVYGEGSSRFWGDYLMDVAEQLDEVTIRDDEDEEEEDDAESPLSTTMHYERQSPRLGDEELEGDGRPLKLLELFKGTGSIGKAAKKLGFSVVSLDFDPIYTPDIETDILKWDYKKYHRDTGYVPDLIWASPPCNTFSPFAYRLKERNTKTSTPYSARAKEGTAILRQTLKIIKYFQKLNPELLFVMENPRGMMRHDPEVKKLPKRDTTLYCLYGDVRYKPTDFFNNVPKGLELKEDKSCNKPTVLVARLPLNKRYEIPAKLSREILETMRDAYKKPMTGGADFTDSPEEIERRTNELTNAALRVLINFWQAFLDDDEDAQDEFQREHEPIRRRLQDYIDTIPQALRQYIGEGDARLYDTLMGLREEVRRRIGFGINKFEISRYNPETKKGGTRTHRENVLDALGLEDKGYSLKELADASGVSKSILQKVYNRGIGAYKTNPQSVRMKGTFKKNVNAPMSKKLSKEQWGMARVYSFLDSNPSHDQDLRGGRRRALYRNAEEVRRESLELLEETLQAKIDYYVARLEGESGDEEQDEFRKREDEFQRYVLNCPVQFRDFLADESDTPLHVDLAKVEKMVEDVLTERGFDLG